MAENKKRPIEHPIFKGSISAVQQFDAYMNLMKNFDFHKDGKEDGFTLRVHPKNKEDESVYLVFQGRDKDLHLRYVSGKGVNPEDLPKGEKKIPDRRVAFSCRIDDIIDQGETIVEGFCGAPKPKGLTDVGRFEYAKVILNACKLSDDRKRINGEANGKTEESKESEESDESDAPERMFTGIARDIGHVSAYFDLMKNAYPNHPDFALVFSCHGKLPFYLGLEPIEGGQAGKYYVTCGFYPEKVEISEKNQAQPDKYVLNRLNARLKAGELRIEGYTNPDVFGTGVTFQIPRHVDQFLFDLVKRIDDITVTPETDEEAKEDHDTTVIPAQGAVKDLPKGFKDEADVKLDNFFGDKK